MCRATQRLQTHTAPCSQPCAEEGGEEGLARVQLMQRGAAASHQRLLATSGRVQAIVQTQAWHSSDWSTTGEHLQVGVSFQHALVQAPSGSCRKEVIGQLDAARCRKLLCLCSQGSASRSVFR